MRYRTVTMSQYCEAKDRLKIRTVLVVLVSLQESKEAGDRTLGEVIGRFLRNAWAFIKQDQDTQKDIITYLSYDPEDCDRSLL